MLPIKPLALTLLALLFACAPEPDAPRAERAEPVQREPAPDEREADAQPVSRTIPATRRREKTETAAAEQGAPRIEPADVAVFWPLGSASGGGPNNPLNQGFGVHKPGGFDKWVSDWIRPLYTKGFRRLIVHNPLGNDPGNNSMDIDQAYDAHELDRDWNIREFDQALERIGREMPGMQVIVYIGTRNDDTRQAAEEGRFRDHLVRNASMFLLTRILDHEHVTIAFDAASNFEDDDPERHMIEMIRAYKRRQGHEIYVEPIPIRAWEKDYAWIALERYYHKRAQRAAPLDSPDAIRIYNTPGDSKAWDGDGWAWIADCVRKGHTPALGWNLAADGPSTWAGMSAAQVAARASALAARPAPRP